jgi:uncharacterized protein YgbK (DUF1537 family)
MSESVFDKIKCLTALPSEKQNNLLSDIQSKVRQTKQKIVILDDDPTGTQTIHSLPVLTNWAVENIIKELQQDDPAFFILTNSRSLNSHDACDLGRKIGENLKAATKTTGIETVVISRSDSTLRGHFPQEVDAVAEAMGDSNLPYLVIPFFLEGGRFTINDVHYVQEGDQLIPAAQTSYASDASFGFKNSNLCQWVEEKTSGRITKEAVCSISLDDIRLGGPKQVTEKLLKANNYSACIVNAASYRDIEVFVTGLLEAEKQEKRFLYRTAASFVRVRVGIKPRKDMLAKRELISDTKNGGLFIVGSHVPKTTAQVKALIESTDIIPVEINVNNLLDDQVREREVSLAVENATKALLKGEDTVIYTSRDLITGQNAVSSLIIGQRISAALITIVKSIKCQPRYLVAKGGITSSDIATKGLNVQRAMVLGQVLPGIPVWKLGEETRYPGMPYIIFPGNVGDDSALAAILKKLS